MGSQVELVYRNLVMQPEMKATLANISGLRETANRYAIFLEEFPRHVSQERQALLKAIDDKASTIHTVNTDIQATFKQADVMLQGLQQTVAGADTLIASTETLIGRLEPYVSPETVTIDDYFKAIETVGDIVAGSNRLVLAVDQTGMPLISTMLE